MNLESYIKDYDNTLPLENISSLIKWSLTQSFDDAGIGGKNTVDKKIRNVEMIDLISFDNKSKTKTHWGSYLGKFFQTILSIFDFFILLIMSSKGHDREAEHQIINEEINLNERI